MFHTVYSDSSEYGLDLRQQKLNDDHTDTYPNEIEVFQLEQVLQ